MPRQSQASSLTYGDNMPQNVLAALNMILQSREQRERADVAAALSGMELHLREQEMASMALDRSERRNLEDMRLKQMKKEFELKEDQFDILEDKEFREKLIQIQVQQLQNLTEGAEKIFVGMFSDIYAEATADGQNHLKQNQKKLKDILEGKRYGFSKDDSAVMARYIISYGAGGDKPNAHAMSDLATWMMERYTSKDKVFSDALVRGGMVADPRVSPKSFTNWLVTLKGMEATARNVISLKEDWNDLSDGIAENDYTLRPLEGVMDFIKKPATDKTTGMGGGAGASVDTYDLSVQLSALEAESKAIADYNANVLSIRGDDNLTDKAREDALRNLKFQKFDESGEPIEGKTAYQDIFSRAKIDYNIAPGYFGGGVKGGDLYGKNIYMDTNEYASLEPEDAVDYIAERRDVLSAEKRDAEREISKLSNSIKLRTDRKTSLGTDWSDAVKIVDETDRISLFRETERLDAINIKADIETERYIGDSWWGAGNEARSFRTGAMGYTKFPYELLTKSEQEKLDSQRKAMSELGSSPGIMYK